MSQDKTSRDKTSQGKNVSRDKTSQDKASQVIRSQRQNVPTNYQVFKKKFVLENWQHMLGNGPQPCTKFMIGVFLFWGG